MDAGYEYSDHQFAARIEIALITLIGMYRSGVTPDSFGVMPIHQQGQLVMETGETVLWEGTTAAALADYVDAAHASNSAFTRLWQVSQPLTVTVTNLRTVFRVTELMSLQMGRDLTLDGAAEAYKRRGFKRPDISDFSASGQVRHRWLFRVDASRDAGEYLTLLVMFTSSDPVFIRVKMLVPNGAEDLAQLIVRAPARERLEICSTLPDAEEKHIERLRIQGQVPERQAGLWGDDYFLPYGFGVGHADLPYTIKSQRRREEN